MQCALRPPTRDVGLAFAVLAVVSLEGWTGLLGTSGPLASVAALALAAPLAWRRRAPLLVAALVGSTVLGWDLAGISLDVSLGPMLAVMIASYTAAANLPFQPALVALGVVGALVEATVLVDTGPVPGDLTFAAIVFVAPWLAGRGMQVRTRYAQMLEERTTQLEQERELLARVAVSEERARVSRELHDVLAHAVSVMTLQVGGVRRLLTAGQQREREVLLAVERTGREALDELHRMLGSLRDLDDASRDPQPGLGRLAELVESLEHAGLDAHLRVDGAPTHLPPGLDLAAYRIAQEALTNVLKHAYGARTDVLVRYGDDTVVVEVSDDGRGRALAPVGPGGHGLANMRERVRLYGGELHSGRAEHGGFVVRAKLPIPRETI